MEKYEFCSRTGEGAYGSVWRARDKNTGILVAVKKMKDVPTSEEEGEIAMREVRVLQLAKHVNIVSLLEAYKSQSGRLYLVFEYVERTLLQELRANRAGMPPPVVKSITWQLLQALSYLHRKQIIHRDVKPSNILLTDGGVVKVCDFGFARACDNAALDPAYTTYVVTRWYRPPEVLVGDTYGPPVDIWALGCIFAEMLLGRPLFPGKNHHDQLWLILKTLGSMTERQLDLLDADPQFACFRLPTQSEIESLEHRLGGVGPAAMELLRACLDPDPKQRASAEELLSLPYFDGVTNALPVAELSAFPDPDMRARLDRALAQDQANAAAAAAREMMMLAHSSRRGPAATPSTKHLHHHLAVTSAAGGSSGGVSPAHLAQQQQHVYQQPVQQGGVGLHLPAKAATALKLDACGVGGGGGGGGEPQRPPLQRHITAPAGSMAARAAGQLQPLGEQQYCGGQHLLQGPQSAGVGAAPGPAPLSSMGPARGRSSWRVSGDGSGDGGGLPMHPAVRQLCGPGRAQLPQAAGVGASAATPAPETAVASAHRPPYQRATWNGSMAPRSNGGAGSTGGAGSAGGAASNGGAGSVPAAAPAGAALQGSFSSSLTNNYCAAGYETVTLHRKAHSLAGNEGLLPPTTSAPVGVRNLMTLGGVQGRSLAPALAPGISTAGAGLVGNSASAPNAIGGFPLPSSQLALPAAGACHQRASVSPPPLAYGASCLRGTNSLPLGPLSVCQTGRPSHDGSVSGFAVGHGCAPLARPPQAVAALAMPAAGGLPSNAAGENGAPLGAEASDGSLTESVTANHNEGRRASDTVLYAALVIKESKGRADKAAVVQLPLGTGRPQPPPLQPPPNQQQHCPNDGTGSGGSSGGGAQGLGSLRNGSSFSRGLALGLSNLAPSSPDCVGVPVPANLPPLHSTPQRRISAPEGMVIAALTSGSSGGGASVGHARGPSQTVSGGTVTAIAHTQRHRHPSGQLGHPSVGGNHNHSHQHPPGHLGHSPVLAAAALASLGSNVAATADGVDVGTAHVLLPALDPGGYGGKTMRVSSAGNGNGGGIGGMCVLGVTRRPSKGTLRVVYGPDAQCKREDVSKVLLLEAVPEAGVL